MALEIRSVGHAYDSQQPVLQDISLDIQAGETIALVGRNGAGKSTLAKICCGLITPSRGSVHINGSSVLDLPPALRASAIGYVFQDPSAQLFASTVRNELEYGPQNIGMSRSECRESVKMAMEMTGITELAEANPHDLPLSQRRMVALASVLAMKCGCIILDEPTAGLDLVRHDLLTRLLKHLHDEQTTTITISHDMNFCAEHMQRIIAIHSGHIEADLRPEAFFADADKVKQLGLTLPEAAALARSSGLGNSCCRIADLLKELRQRTGSQHGGAHE